MRPDSPVPSLQGPCDRSLKSEVPAVPASTGDEALFQCTKPSGVPRGPSHLQFPWLLRATTRSPLRSPAQVEGTQGFLPQPGKALERHSSTRLEARFPYHDSGAMTRSPSPLAWRPDFPVPHERLTDLAVVPREKPHTGAAAREQPRDSPVIERGGPSFPAWPRDQSRGLSPNASGGWTPLSPPSALQEIPVAIREQSGVLCFHSR